MRIRGRALRPMRGTVPPGRDRRRFPVSGMCPGGRTSAIPPRALGTAASLPAASRLVRPREDGLPVPDSPEGTEAHLHEASRLPWGRSASIHQKGRTMSRFDRDPEKHRAWKRRSKGLKRGNGLKRTSGINRRSAKGGRSSQPPRSRPQPTTGFRLWVRAALRCAVPGCGTAGPDPHHVRATGMGGRRDPWGHDETNVCPLCRRHHGLGESPGWSWQRFGEHFGIDLAAIADTVWKQWMALPAEERARWEGRAYRINRKNGVPESRARRPLG